MQIITYSTQHNGRASEDARTSSFPSQSPRPVSAGVYIRTRRKKEPDSPGSFNIKPPRVSSCQRVRRRGSELWVFNGKHKLALILPGHQNSMYLEKPNESSHRDSPPLRRMYANDSFKNLRSNIRELLLRVPISS
eukprot:GHVT01023555.1.p1 GENE.GHVT01023555.1~~GHVT01023555.1.p1  ORF type:complete len:135 (-),score=5.62 GHVT01023555.1:358-762(-)